MRLRDPQQQQEATNWTGSRTTQRDRQNAAGDTQMHCGGETGGETKIKEGKQKWQERKQKCFRLDHSRQGARVTRLDANITARAFSVVG